MGQLYTRAVASQVAFAPSGDLSGTNVQLAINELDDEKASSAGLSEPEGSASIGHIASGSGANETDVQAKLRQVITDGDYNTSQNAAIAAIGKPFMLAAAAAVTITVGADVASLGAALTAIARWVIPADATVTIALPTGTTALAAPVTINHPYGSRIKIEGAATVTTTASAAGAVTGAAGAWSVPLTVASAAGIAANDYVLIRNVAGTGRYNLFAGICKVTNVAGTTVTVTNTARNAAWPAATLTGADITVIKSVLSFTGCDGLQINGPLGSLDKVAIVGNKTAGTIGIISQRMAQGLKGKGYVYIGSSAGVSGFGDGGVYAQYGGTIDAPYLCIADCLIYNALAQHSGSLYINNGIVSGGVEAGIAASNSGDVSAQNAIACGNGTYGLFAFGGGTILARDASVWANVSDGARAAWGGAIRADNLNSQYNGSNGVFAVSGDIVVPAVVASNNAGVGLYAEGGSIYANNATISTNTSYGVYADGGMVDCPSATATANGINGYTATNNGVVLASGANGAGNTTYSFSATNSGYVRATTADATGTVYAEKGGCVDVTGASGGPTLTAGQEGLIIGASTTRGSILLDGNSNLAIGATNTAAFNLDKTANVYTRMAKSGAVKVLIGVDDGGSLIVGAADGDLAIRSEATIWFAAGGANERGFIDTAGNAALGRASLGTGATDGFLYLPACAGTPTGAATAKAGRTPLVVDTTGEKLWAYLGGAWKSVTFM